MNDSLPPRSRSGRITAVAIVLAAIVAVAAGWGLATLFQSTAQRDAATTPPASKPIFASVSTGQLVKESSFSGSVVAENEESLSFAVPTGAQRSVVTGRPVAAGTSVTDGHVVSEVNGRPVFAVKSGFPFYRDVGPGDHGPDVLAIQQTLKGLGYPLSADGEFGARTEAVVREWYTRNGYTPALRDASESGTTPDAGTPAPDGPKATDGSTAYIPYAEVLGIATLPSVALSELIVGADVGVEGKPDLSLGSATTKIVFDATAADLTHLSPGSKVSIDASGSPVSGTIASIDAIDTNTTDEDQPRNGDGQDTSRVTVTPSQAFPASATKVRVVSSEMVVDTPSLLVPAIAVIDRGDTNQIVVVKRPDGTLTEVEVRVLGTLDGKAAIEPVTPSAVRDGDQVRVGAS